MDREFVLVVFPLLVLGWLSVTALVSLLSGWRTLAREFQSKEPLVGDVFRFRSGAMRRWFFPIHYGNCLTVTVGHEAFALSVLFPFGFLHPRLLIPWTAVARCEARGSLFPRVILDLSEPHVQITLKGDLADRIEAAYGRAETAPSQ